MTGEHRFDVSYEQMLIHGVLPEPVRSAIGFCAEHARDPVTITDIAAASRTSVRSLQRQFRSCLGMSPLEYLQRVRLKRVHHDLLDIAAGRAEGTVADVAGRWGFAHLGRFAGVYRRTYGHSPVRTLRAKVPAGTH